jgi:septum formation protein
MDGPPLLLASTSPRRAALLAAAGYRFAAVDPGVDEEALGRDITSPSRRATVLALAKARAVAARRPDGMSDRIVIGADTLVVLDAEALGKPRDAAHALWMLSRLSGQSHEVVTGVAAVAPDGREAAAWEATLVEFGRLPAGALAALAASPGATDKAGAYAIQEAAGAFVTRLDGSYDNVVGLPLGALRRVLAAVWPGVDAPRPAW